MRRGAVYARRIGTKSAAEPYNDSSELEHRLNAIEGSLKLRDAIFRAAGYHVPEPPAPRYRKQNRRGPGHPKTHKLVRKTDPRITRIIQVTARRFKIEPEALTGHITSQKLVFPRWIAIYIAHRTTPASSNDLGFNFGGRDHSTILYALRQIENRIAKVDGKTLHALNVIHKALSR